MTDTDVPSVALRKEIILTDAILVVHGGAGVIRREDMTPDQDALRR